MLNQCHNNYEILKDFGKAFSYLNNKSKTSPFSQDLISVGGLVKEAETGLICSCFSN